MNTISLFRHDFLKAYICLTGSALFLEGCASSTTPVCEAHIAQEYCERATGTLKVVTPQAWRSVNERLCYAHSDYRLLTSAGKFLRNVSNTGPLGDSEPETISIPAGSYLVVAPEEGHGVVNIPVAVRAGETTVLQLDHHGAQ